jgi:predicted acetyltransferase
VDIELRPITDGEHPAFARAVSNAFGYQAGEAEVAEVRASAELDRWIALFDGTEIVGTAGAYTFELTVPGPAAVPAAGVTMVSVRATHRRRGLLTTMMEHQLDDVAERGEPVAVLTASEGAIYERFGYGIATFTSWWHARTEHLELAHPAAPGGDMRLVSLEEASGVVPGLYDEVRRTRVGEVTRNEGVWDAVFADRRHNRRQGSGLFAVLHEAARGPADGFALYRIIASFDQHHADNTVLVSQVEARDGEVEAALWQFLLSIDLVKTIRSGGRPTDEALRWRLRDPRRLHVDHVNDHLWVRIVDPVAALQGRRYAVDDELVLELTDSFRPQNDGRWALATSGTYATVERTSRPADLELDVAALGSVYLGGVAPTTLARAGRIRECTGGTLARADRLFGAHPAPWCATDF